MRWTWILKVSNRFAPLGRFWGETKSKISTPPKQMGTGLVAPEIHPVFETSWVFVLEKPKSLPTRMRIPKVKTTRMTFGTCLEFRIPNHKSQPYTFANYIGYNML